MENRTIITTKQAETQLAALPQVEAEMAQAFITNELPTARGKKLGPAPFGEGKLVRFRAGRVRVLVAVEPGVRTVVGFGLRKEN